MGSEVVVAAFYKFVTIDDREELRRLLYIMGWTHELSGTVLLAREGINSTLCGSREGIDAMLAFLRSDPRFADLEHKESFTDETVFGKFWVRMKREIVAMGVPSVDPNRLVGHYVEAKDWNELISDPEVIVVDTRNDYEFGIGTFRGALDPKTASFREFPEYVNRELAGSKDKRIAMFCTGGIRCEKATSYLLEQGFSNVFHLKGGILKYIEEIPEEQSLWEGECFIFDKRRALDHDLKKTENIVDA